MDVSSQDFSDSKFSLRLLSLSKLPHGRLLSTLTGFNGKIIKFYEPPPGLVLAYNPVTFSLSWAHPAAWSEHTGTPAIIVTLESGHQIFTDDDPRALFGYFFEADCLTPLRKSPYRVQNYETFFIPVCTFTQPLPSPLSNFSDIIGSSTTCLNFAAEAQANIFAQTGKLCPIRWDEDFEKFLIAKPIDLNTEKLGYPIPGCLIDQAGVLFVAAADMDSFVQEHALNESIQAFYYDFISPLILNNVAFSRIHSFVQTTNYPVGHDLTIPGIETFVAGTGVILSNTLNVQVPISNEAVNDIKTKLLPSKQIFSIRDPDKVVNLPEQDFVAALFHALDKPAQKTHYFKTFKEMQNARKEGKISLRDNVIIEAERPSNY